MNINLLSIQSKNLWLGIFIFPLLFSYTSKTLSDGIFDIPQTRTATSKVEFNAKKSGGISTYKTEPITLDKLKVSYTFDRKETPNPLLVSYDFEIRKLKSGRYEMDMIGAMPFMSMYIDKSIEITYTGNHPTYTNQPKIGEILPTAAGSFQLKNKKTKQHFLTYEVAITNRKILRTETIKVKGKNYTAYVYTYDFSQKTILNTGQTLSILREQVSEWLIPSYGIVKQDRTGALTTSISNTEDNKALSIRSLSQILNIQ